MNNKEHFDYNKIEDGWKLLEDTLFNKEKQFAPNIIAFLKPGEPCMNGEKMKLMAKRLNAHLGQHHAEYLLKNQNLIPKEWQEYHLVFPGTVWLNKGAIRLVPCLYWNGGKWSINFNWLGHDWHNYNYLVSSRE